MKKVFQIMLALGIALLTGCATRPSSAPIHNWSQPCDTCITGVQNFTKVTPKLWRRAQPTAAGFRNLVLAGVKTVIDLRESHDDYNDYSKLGGTQVKYIRIPMHAWNPEEAQLVLLMGSNSQFRVFNKIK